MLKVYTAFWSAVNGKVELESGGRFSAWYEVVPMSGVLCPVCKNAELDTVVSAPYIRGMLLAYTFGTKRFVGCNRCVKKQLAKELGVSMVVGWFSLTSLLVNPVCILWNGARLPFLRANPRKVADLLAEFGIDTSEPAARVDIPRVAASLAAAMVNADGKVGEDEILVAVEIGQKLFDGFDLELFRDVLLNSQSLPNPTQLASVLRDYLTEDGKVAVQKYLVAIAVADGSVAPQEIDILRNVSFAMGLQPPDLSPPGMSGEVLNENQ
ncbi:MAG: TerB family tellurite resistance protein [Vulcanimicrobiota bacterium]